MPGDAETYVHRIGRTGRAGAKGKAISFCTEEQKPNLREVEKLLGRRIPVMHHSLKGPSESEITAGLRTGGRTHHRAAAGSAENKGGHAHKPGGKPASPQQQKNRFWQSKRKTNRTGPGERKGR